MWSILERILGAAIYLVVLADIFLTVLYARIGTGIISDRLARSVWWLFCLVARPLASKRAAVLSFCGPAIVILLITVWILGLALGAGLMIHPHLGSGISASNGPTPTDFTTALYAGAGSISIVGSSDLVPRSAPLKLFFLLNAMIGTSIISLTLTYLMQVYTALRERNAFGLRMHELLGETGDAAELIAGLAPQGHVDGAYTIFAELAADMARQKEAHHFYPVLFYFRFQQSFYSVSLFTFSALDAVALVKTALDDERYGWLKQSAPVTQLWFSALRLVITLEEAFLPGGPPERLVPDEDERERWRNRYRVALKRLRQAGIVTIADERAGAEAYIALRAQYDRHATTLAPIMAYDKRDIDPVTADPALAEKRPDFGQRLRGIGSAGSV